MSFRELVRKCCTALKTECTLIDTERRADVLKTYEGFLQFCLLRYQIKALSITTVAKLTHLKHNGLTTGNVFTKMNTNINPAQVLFYLKS